jgi:phage terminase small subunit
MIPSSYLNKKGKGYFKTLEAILVEKGLAEDSFSIKLSMLANELAKYEECHLEALEREKKGLPGFYNEYENKTVQVNAFFTMAKEASSSIDKLSAKFGLTPLDQSKIKDMMKEPEVVSALDNI